jgi:hypothetical protein
MVVAEVEHRKKTLLERVVEMALFASSGPAQHANSHLQILEMFKEILC